MATIDPSIALNVKPIQLDNPLAQYSQFAQAKNAQNQNALAELQLQAAQRANDEDIDVRNYLTENPDLNTLEAQNKLMSFGKTGLAYSKLLSEQRTAALSQQELQQKLYKAKRDFGTQALRDLSMNPSDENIIAFGQDAVIQKFMTPEESAVKTKQLLSMPVPERQAYMAAQGAQSKELMELFQSKPVERTDGQRKWLEESNPRLPTFGQVVRPAIQMQATPEAVLNADVTKRGQDIGANTAAAGQRVTMRGQDLVNAREKENLQLRKEAQRRDADPVFQQNMAQAKATGQAIAKDKALAEQVLPKVLSTAESTLGLIDSLVGAPPVLDKNGKVVKQGTKPHPGFETAVGASWTPGARFVPGTDASDFQARFDQLQGGAFLQAFETLKGGGSITNVEGEKGTAALNRMNLAQSEKEFVQAAREFQDVVRKGVERAKKRVGGGVSTTNSANDVIDTSNPLLR